MQLRALLPFLIAAAALVSTPARADLRLDLRMGSIWVLDPAFDLVAAQDAMPNFLFVAGWDGAAPSRWSWPMASAARGRPPSRRSIRPSCSSRSRARRASVFRWARIGAPSPGRRPGSRADHARRFTRCRSHRLGRRPRGHARHGAAPANFAIRRSLVEEPRLHGGGRLRLAARRPRFRRGHGGGRR